MVTSDTIGDDPLLDKSLCDLLAEKRTPPSERIAALLNAGASANARGTWRESPALSIAAFGGHVEAMQQLLNAGADIMATGSSGNNCLHDAAYRNQPHAVSLILAHPKASELISQRNKEMETPFNYLFDRCSWGDLEPEQFKQVIGTLLNAGADASIPDRWGNSALVKCASYDLPETLALLLQQHGSVEPALDLALCAAIRALQPNNARQLLAAGGRLNQVGPVNCSLAHFTVYSCHGATLQQRLDTLALLGQWGESIDLPDDQGWTPLGFLLQNSREPQLIEALLDMGARIPDFTPDPPRATIHMRREQAEARWSEIFAAAPPDVARLSATDLIWFANIDRLDTLLDASLWRGNEAHLHSLLTDLPPPLAGRVASLCLAIEGTPSGAIAAWNYEGGGVSGHSPDFTKVSHNQSR